MATKKNKKLKAKSKGSLKQAKSKANFQLIISIILIVFGCSLVFIASWQNFNYSLLKKPQIDKQANLLTAKEKAHSPVLIIIPSINKTLPVEDGTYTKGRWTVSQNGVSFYKESALPGTRGNTVLYGHDRKDVLGDIYGIRSGDQIQVRMDNSDVVNYVVYETKTIKPTDVSILNQTNEPRLTLYTCAGFLDTARFVVLAHLI